MRTSLRSAFAHSPALGLRTLVRKLGFAFAVFMIVSPAILVFLWMLSLSLKTELDNTSYPPVFWPSEPAWYNYVTIFEQNPFLLYIGRIDANKGCAQLFDLFLEWQRVRYLTLREREVDLVLIGRPVLEIPNHPRIRHLGFVSDADKFDVLAAASLLVMPSYYESLSMVALEAWALGKPVLANARCDVLLGQCIRSNAGLYYENAGEFGGAVDAILDSPGLADAMGQRGRRYYADHYDWPVIERKYLDMFARLTATPPAHDMEPLPGFLDRRRRDKPPADAVVASLPSGPVRAAENLLETGA